MKLQPTRTKSRKKHILNVQAIGNWQITEIEIPPQQKERRTCLPLSLKLRNQSGLLAGDSSPCHLPFMRQERNPDITFAVAGLVRLLHCGVKTTEEQRDT